MKKKRIVLGASALVSIAALLGGLLLSCAPRDKAISLGDAIDYLGSSVAHMADPKYFAVLQGLSYSYSGSLSQTNDQVTTSLLFKEAVRYSADPYTIDIGFDEEIASGGSSSSEVETAYGGILSKDEIGNYQLIESSSSAVYDTANPSYARYAGYFNLGTFLANSCQVYLSLASDCLSAIKDSTPNHLEDYRCLSSGKGNLVLYLYGGFDLTLGTLSRAFPQGYLAFGSLDLIVSDYCLESAVFHFAHPTSETWAKDAAITGNLSVSLAL